MARYTIVNLREVEDQAPKFGYSPDPEARFARVPLKLENSGISYFQVAPNFRIPFGHKHQQQEEVYVLVGGSARMKLDDEVVELKPRDSSQFQIVPELEPLPSEAVSDKIAMSAFEGTFLDTALRDLGIVSFSICGIATEVGIEPSVRHGTDLGYVPVIIEDACGAGDEAVAERSLEVLKFAGDALSTNTTEISGILRRTRNSDRR